jgi:3-hydroxy-9,10-secoandrosta-1,3,5(10)-triene-9,17-dione monooxygenase
MDVLPFAGGLEYSSREETRAGEELCVNDQGRGVERARETHDAVLGRVRELTGRIRDAAGAAEEARTISPEIVDALLGAGISRILIPPRFGGYGLGLDTWFEVVREIGKADASHAWCASLMIHHPHYVSQFPEEAQKAVWEEGLDQSIAASIQPAGQVERVEGGYRLSGQFSFASGINHSRWLIVGALLHTEGGPDAVFFLVRPQDYRVEDSWFTTAMRATGSNTAICDNVFVPENFTVRLSDLREGKGPGGALHGHPLYRAPFITYAPLTFVTPMLGAAQGAYEIFRDWIKGRRTRGGAVTDIVSIQVRLARAAADLDAAEFLLRRAVDVAQAPQPASLAIRARSMRDCSRAVELCVGAIDALLTMSGTAGFSSSHPIQRAWRDLHFAAMHAALNVEQNLSHFGRLELGLPRDPHLPFF